jgi:hypothetical protein
MIIKSICPWYYLVLLYLLIFCLGILSIDDSGELRYLTLIVSEPICSFKLRSVCFMNLDAPVFHAYIFRTDTSSCLITPFIGIL